MIAFVAANLSPSSTVDFLRFWIIKPAATVSITNTIQIPNGIIVEKGKMNEFSLFWTFSCVFGLKLVLFVFDNIFGAICAVLFNLICLKIVGVVVGIGPSILLESVVIDGTGCKLDFIGELAAASWVTLFEDDVIELRIGRCATAVATGPSMFGIGRVICEG